MIDISSLRVGNTIRNVISGRKYVVMIDGPTVVAAYTEIASSFSDYRSAWDYLAFTPKVGDLIVNLKTNFLMIVMSISDDGTTVIGRTITINNPEEWTLEK